MGLRFRARFWSFGYIMGEHRGPLRGCLLSRQFVRPKKRCEMFRFRSESVLRLLLGLLVFLSGSIASAQTVTGTISGTVKDNSGAGIAGAKVEVLNQDTGTARSLVTDVAGRYSAVLLPLGNYRVTSTHEGFQTE